MKRTAAVLCVVMLLFALAACGDQTSNVKNDQKETTKIETSNASSNETAKASENDRVKANNEEVLLDLLTIRNLCNDFERINEIKDGAWDFEIDSGVREFIDDSKSLGKEIKNKLLSSIHDGWGGCRFRAIVDLEIEKHKLP